MARTPETVTARPGSDPPEAPLILAGVDGRPVVVLPLHGVAHDDDLTVQAFARHLDAAAPVAGRSIVAGMRAFLEGKPQLAPSPPWSLTGSVPATGDAAVELLGLAAGCSPDEIERARRASRHDLGSSAWILDPADGLSELLDLLAGRADLVLIADPDDRTTGPVLDALELADRFAVIRTAELQDVLTGRRALLIDTAWEPALAAACATGPTTALVDRFGTGDGAPDLRASDLPGLLPGITTWLDGPPSAGSGGG